MGVMLTRIDLTTFQNLVSLIHQFHKSCGNGSEHFGSQNAEISLQNETFQVSFAICFNIHLMIQNVEPFFLQDFLLE